MFNTTDLLGQFLLLFGLNLATVFVLVAMVYYKRYHDKKGFVAFMLFNIFLFTVVFFLIRNDAVVSLGFAIFGILSLIRLRSNTYTKIEITYYFLAMSIAVLNGMVVTEHIPVMIAVNVLLLGCVYVFDHPALFSHSHQTILYKLDSIPPGILHNPEQTKESLSTILSTTVTDYEIIEIDAIKDSVQLHITYQK